MLFKSFIIIHLVFPFVRFSAECVPPAEYSLEEIIQSMRWDDFIPLFVHISVKPKVAVDSVSHRVSFQSIHQEFINSFKI